MCNFTFSQIYDLFLTFVAEKLIGFFLSSPFKKIFLSCEPTHSPPPENNVYRDFF